MAFVADGLSEFGDFVQHVFIFFFLHNQLTHHLLTVLLLGFELLLQLSILLDQQPVLVVNALGNRCNELEVVLHLVLSFLEITFLIVFI